MAGLLRFLGVTERQENTTITAGGDGVDGAVIARFQCEVLLTLYDCFLVNLVCMEMPSVL